MLLQHDKEPLSVSPSMVNVLTGQALIPRGAALTAVQTKTKDTTNLNAPLRQHALLLADLVLLAYEIARLTRCAEL